MFTNSTSEYLFVPAYFTIFLLLLVLVYIITIILGLIKYRLGKVSIFYGIVSILSFVMILFYMIGSGYFADEAINEMRILPQYGLMESLLMIFPFLFLTLALVFAKKR